MKSTELRIGNIIESRTKHPVKANWGTLRALENGEKTYFPIPLTEEWLVKLGFKKENYFTYDNGLISISLPSEDPLLWRNGRTYFNSWKICDAPKYVHNLQNIYFALTDNELQCEGF